MRRLRRVSETRITITMFALLTICGKRKKFRVAISMIVTKQTKYTSEKEASIIKSAN